MKFVGGKNYIQIFQDPAFWSAFSTNVIYVLFFSIVPILLGLLVASIIGRAKIRGVRFFRTIYFIPQVVPAVAIGIIFGWVYAPQFGFINSTLQQIGLGHLQEAWLGNSTVAPFSVGLIGTWMWLGFSVILFLSGIQKIDEYIYDSAKIDGANSWQQFWYITLPNLRNEIVIAVIVTLIRALSSTVFGIVSAATGGSHNTRPISLYAYQLAFVENKVGYGASTVVILGILLFSISSITMITGESST